MQLIRDSFFVIFKSFQPAPPSNCDRAIPALFPFQNLIPELKTHIFSFFDYKQQIVRRQVSREWKILLDDFPIQRLIEGKVPFSAEPFTHCLSSSDDMEKVKKKIGLKWMDSLSTDTKSIQFLIHNIWFFPFELEYLDVLNRLYNIPLFTAVLREFAISPTLREYQVSNIDRCLHLDEFPEQIKTEALRLGLVSLERILPQHRTSAIYAAAVTRNPFMLRHVPLDKRTDHIYQLALSRNGEVLDCLSEEEKTVDRCVIAYSQTCYAMDYTPFRLRLQVRERLGLPPQ